MVKKWNTRFRQVHSETEEDLSSFRTLQPLSCPGNIVSRDITFQIEQPEKTEDHCFLSLFNSLNFLASSLISIRDIWRCAHPYQWAKSALK